MPSSRVIVLRGDLYSDTGYARATRALAAVLAQDSPQVFAVSLHEHRHRRHSAIDFPVVDDDALRSNSRFHGATIINVCFPDAFVRIAGAVNVGFFFWETDCLPPALFWKARLMTMDRLWAPSRWQSQVLRKITGRSDIPVIPWPLPKAGDIAPSCITSLCRVRAHRGMSASERDNHQLRAMPLEGRRLERELEAAEHARGCSRRFEPHRSQTLGALFERKGDVFLAVQTDAARKGLPLLLASWLRFKASPEGRDALLVVKMSALDVSIDLPEAHFRASLALHQATRRCGVEEPGIVFVHERLSCGEMRSLLRRADAFVSVTLGEGFGGPIAEALIEGTPVVAPRHTSIEGILDADYPLIVASVPHRLQLWNNLDVYSAASLWHVVEDASFVACLKSFAHMPSERRRGVAEAARARLLRRAGVPAVATALHREFDLLDAFKKDGSGSMANDAHRAPVAACAW